MPYQNLEPVSKQVTIVIGLSVVGFMAFGLALSYYRNVLFDQTLIEIAAQNEALDATIAQGYRDLEYYRSAQYKDKYAKENLGLLNPGEKVLIIRQPAITDVNDIESQSGSIAEAREAAYEELLRQTPILDHWHLYLFAPEKVEELKKGL
jgi:cell division protein FtsB